MFCPYCRKPVERLASVRENVVSVVCKNPKCESFNNPTHFMKEVTKP